MKSWLLGAVIGGLSLGSASAADLPVAPEPVDYVRVCDSFGAGYYYIPGTDTCLSFHGRVRVEYRYFDSEYAANWRNYNSSQFRARGYIYMDSRTNTEFGLLRTFNETYVTADSPGATRLTLNHAFIQFGGFTFGKTQSFFDFVHYTTWASVYYPAVSDQKVPLAAYTYAFGNGFAASLSLESADDRRSGIDNYGPGYGGTKYPDLVGALTLNQGWGTLQLSGAVHQVYAGYNATGTTPDSEPGWAIGAGVDFNLPMIGEGTSLNVSGSYSQGAVAYVSSTLDSPAGTYDAVLDASNDLELSSAWGVSAGFAHNWTPTIATAVQGGYVDYQNDAAPTGDYGQWSLQGTATWSPVTGLLIGTGIEYEYLDMQAGSGFGDGDNLVGMFRVQRTY